MSTSEPRKNTPLPDELAAVRAEIKRLESREEQLRASLLANPAFRTGTDYLAEIKTVTQQRTDLKEMRANYPEIVEQFTFPSPVTMVVLKGITEDGEIVSTRSKAFKEKVSS
jgi:predicted phage-related endonuclease